MSAENRSWGRTAYAARARVVRALLRRMVTDGITLGRRELLPIVVCPK